MSIAQISLAELLREHVTLEVESIDRMYLNIYIPKLQARIRSELVFEGTTPVSGGVFGRHGADQPGVC